MADPVSIIEGGSELLADFARLTDEVWAEVDPTATHRPTAGQIAAALSETQPTRRRCSVRLFLIPGRARAAAIINPRLLDGAGQPIGLIGFFESQADPVASTAVLHAAVAWLHAQGATIVRGPVNYSTWHDYRFAVEQTEPGWFAGEPLHPPYYPELWAAAGFVVTSNYGSHWMGDLRAARTRWAPRLAQCADAGITVRPVSAGDVPSLYKLATAGFRDAYMYSAIEPDEFAALYTADRATAVAGTSFIATDGESALGFVYTYVTALPSGPVGVVKTIVVVPEAREHGVYQALLAAALDAFLAAGLTRALAGLMHSDGEPAKMGWCKPELLFKRYVLLEHKP